MARAAAQNDDFRDTLRDTAEDAEATLRDGARTAGASLRDAASDVADGAARAGEKAAEMKDAALEGAAAVASDLNAKLKFVGIDTDVMLGAAKEQAGGLQKMIADELSERPLRALGLAAAAGVVLGFLSSR